MTAAGQEPWRRDALDVAAALGTDVRRGLTAAEAADRLARLGPNELESAEVTPPWRRLLAQFADPLIYLLMAAVVVSLVAWIVEGADGLPFDAIVITAIVVLNGVLGFVQEARAEQAVAALQRMAAATAGVRRDGREERIPTTEVVPGDVLLLAEGDAVSADARLVEAASLMVAEASLTGESEAELKDVATLTEPAVLGDRINMVFNGTAVTRGRGTAVVTGTGMATEMGNVARLLGRTQEEQTPLQREVARIGRTLGLAVVAIAIVVVGAILLTADIDAASDFVDVLLVGVSLAVAAVPEGLPAVLSVVLALGVQRMARRRAIVKKLSSVETLGSASVVCSDKTGTLTRNEMTIQTVVTPSGEVDVTGSGYRPEGELRVDGGPLADGPLRAEVRNVLAAGCLANDAVLRQEDDEWTIQGDPTEAAFLVAEAKVAGLSELREARFERVGEIPFTSERKLMSTLTADIAREGDIAVVTKGAPDVLLARCTAERVAGAVRPLTGDRRAEVLGTVDRLADLALRTLAVAYRPLPDGARPTQDESVERELVYLGLVGIIDPPRAEARAAIAEAAAAGVRVMMITGDHPHTAARIAGDLGIVEPGARVLTGGEIERAGRRAAEGGGPRGVRLRTRRARAQAAHRRRAAGRRRDRRDDRRRGQRRARAQVGRHRRRDGHGRHRRDEGGGGHDPRRRQLRHDHRGDPRGPRDLRQHPQVPALPAVVEHRRGPHDVPRRDAGRRARPRGHRRGDRRAAARHADPVDQPAHRHRARAGDGRRPAARTTSCATRRGGPPTA